MSEQEDVLRKIIKYYIESRDFNGVPSELINNDKVVCELIDDGLVEVLSDADGINPHIRCFEIKTPLGKQKFSVVNHELNAVLYPTEKALATIEIKYNAKYTSMMQRGSKQFDIIYFDIEILERYINNPNYHVDDCGYRGNIWYALDDSDERDYIRDYGMAYIVGEKLSRAVGVFVSDLAKLSPKKQSMWSAFELEHQSQCKIAPGFIKNLVYGDWVDSLWIFDALLEEIKIINRQCECINIPKLFLREYTAQDAVLRDYRYICLPTLKNYNNFIMVLEKIIVSNINKKTFLANGIRVEGLEDNGDKGTLFLLEKWLSKNVYGVDDLQERIIAPLKKLRRERQKPAHELQINKSNVDLYSKQCDLMVHVYSAVRNIRLIFMNHPNTKSVEISDDLRKGKNIVNY